MRSESAKRMMNDVPSDESEEDEDQHNVTSSVNVEATDSAVGENVVHMQQKVCTDRKLPLDVGIAHLAIKHGWSHRSVRDLLELLTKNGVKDLPRDPRTILKTPRHVQVRNLNGDRHQQYHHFGMQECLEDILLVWPKNVREGAVLNLQINVDGTAVNKSTGFSFWPILGILRHETYESAVFCIGTYHGRHPKADSITAYLEDFVNEYQSHSTTGYVVHGKQVHVKLSSIICDAPAMAYVKVTKNFNAYGGCPKCEVFGESIGAMTYPEWNCRRRTDDSFRNRSHRVHHLGNTRSPLEDLGVGMITQIPLDPMHLAFLGVTKRVMKSVLKHLPKELRMSPTNQKLVSAAMLVCARYCPSEFQRRPRELCDLAHFKASEYRSLLCYLGPVLFRRKLATTEQYEHFLLFSCAMRILLSTEQCKQPALVDSAEDMILNFCKRFGNIYGRQQVVYNVHCLSHLAQEARWHGNLNGITSFPFESYLNGLKKKIRQPGRTLEQLVKRVYEERYIQSVTGEVSSSDDRDDIKLSTGHTKGPVPADADANVQQYKSCVLGKTKYSVALRDRTVKCHGRVGQIQNILYDGCNALAVLRFYLKYEDYFDWPVRSSRVGIWTVSQLSETLHVRPLKDCRKVWLVHPKTSVVVAVDLLH